MSDEEKVINKKKPIGVGIGIIIIVILIIIWTLTANRTNNTPTGSETLGESPKYQTLLPNGKSIETLGGWERISPDGKDPVYAYADSIDAVSISVSEQPLPEDFKSNVNKKVADLAERFSATNTIDADGTKVYVGTSTKGPQSVIFARDDLLILIKSQQKIKDAAWKSYIQSLTTPLNAKF